MDPAGAPIDGATARLSRVDPNSRSDTAAAATSNGRGSFRLETVHIGRHLVTVSAPGWFPASAEIVLSSEKREFDIGSIRLTGPDCSSPGVICDDFGVRSEPAR